MSYFNVFFQATICHSWFPAAKLRLKKRSYGNNCDRRILKKHKKSVGERISFSAGLLLLLRNLLHQIIQAHGSALSPEHFSLLEEHEGRDRLNAVLHGQCLAFVFLG